MAAQSLWRREAGGQSEEAGVSDPREGVDREAGRDKMEIHLHRRVCETLREQLDTWVADMRAVPLQHEPPSFTALIQVGLRFRV